MKDANQHATCAKKGFTFTERSKNKKEVSHLMRKNLTADRKVVHANDREWRHTLVTAVKKEKKKKKMVEQSEMSQKKEKANNSIK